MSLIANSPSSKGTHIIKHDSDYLIVPEHNDPDPIVLKWYVRFFDYPHNGGRLHSIDSDVNIDEIRELLDELIILSKDANGITITRQSNDTAFKEHLRERIKYFQITKSTQSSFVLRDEDIDPEVYKITGNMVLIYHWSDQTQLYWLCFNEAGQHNLIAIHARYDIDDFDEYLGPLYDLINLARYSQSTITITSDVMDNIKEVKKFVELRRKELTTNQIDRIATLQWVTRAAWSD